MSLLIASDHVRSGFFEYYERLKKIVQNNERNTTKPDSQKAKNEQTNTVTDDEKSETFIFQHYEWCGEVQSV